jgi:hypothetical protein
VRCRIIARTATLRGRREFKIGGFTDAFHFYPVIVHGNVATIYPHNNLLTYGRTYYAQIDPGVLTPAAGGFTGVAGKRAWTFSTKPRDAVGQCDTHRGRGRRNRRLQAAGKR